MDDFSERTATPSDAVSRSEAMVEPEEVGVMLRLHRLGSARKAPEKRAGVLKAARNRTETAKKMARDLSAMSTESRSV